MRSPVFGRGSALYRTRIVHTRHHPVVRSFTYRGYTWLVDLDDLPRLAPPLRMLARFDAADHVGDADRSIRENLDAWLARHGVDLHGGRILMLCQARSFGYVFNPLTVYWCHRRDGALACVVAEVHNTYGGRHLYLLPAGGVIPRPSSAEPVLTATVDKTFYVSPFLAVDGDYRIRVSPPGAEVRLSIALRQGGAVVFAASLHGRREPASAPALLRLALRRPWETYRTRTWIGIHGVRLWLRRIPVVPRPADRYAHADLSQPVDHIGKGAP